MISAVVLLNFFFVTFVIAFKNANIRRLMKPSVVVLRDADSSGAAVEIRDVFVSVGDSFHTLS
jgi:hypothetical protein